MKAEGGELWVEGRYMDQETRWLTRYKEVMRINKYQ